MKVLVLLSLLCVAPGIAGAQAGNTCRLSVDSTRRQGNFQGNNMFAGGGVFISCFGTRIHMSSDSVAYYAPPIDLVQFIGNVKYEDTTITMTANNGTYFKNGERWEARGTGDGKTLPHEEGSKGERPISQEDLPGIGTLPADAGRLSWHPRAGPSATLDSALQLCGDATDCNGPPSRSTPEAGVPHHGVDASASRALRR